MIKVTYKIDYLDNEPDVEYFDTMQEAHEWADEEMVRRVEWAVTHSPHTVTEKEERELLETEISLISFSEEYDDE
jgi:hypothetical protein